jgi:hypothetical protein
MTDFFLLIEFYLYDFWLLLLAEDFLEESKCDKFIVVFFLLLDWEVFYIEFDLDFFVGVP